MPEEHHLCPPGCVDCVSPPVLCCAQTSDGSVVQQLQRHDPSGEVVNLLLLRLVCIKKIISPSTTLCTHLISISRTISLPLSLAADWM